uniref:Uncharacterized protein n=1 Tax=Alsidium seaforthii TaxID=2007182 RepID=A0A1Z1MDB6_9FLOR|nr:hypothetical protein [Bryothamnion seaforthii]ARW64010.1 hypothetical protein [Bryothamnion seaforthii]
MNNNKVNDKLLIFKHKIKYNHKKYLQNLKEFKFFRI